LGKKEECTTTKGGPWIPNVENRGTTQHKNMENRETREREPKEPGGEGEDGGSTKVRWGT
jgi:hypothetical protein